MNKHMNTFFHYAKMNCFFREKKNCSAWFFVKCKNWNSDCLSALRPILNICIKSAYLGLMLQAKLESYFMPLPMN